MIRVDIHPLAISGDTVRFSWDISTPIPAQPRTAFEIQYHGLDLSTVSPTLLLEVLLALQLRVLARLRRPVTVRLPFAVPAPVVTFWLAYAGSEQIEAGPLSDALSYEPWLMTPAASPPPRKHAVFYTGGRDSLLTTMALAEMSSGGMDDVLLVHLANSYGHLSSGGQQFAEARERRVLGPMRTRFGFRTALARSTFQGTFQGTGAGFRPHFEHYHAGLLPLLLTWGVEFAALSLEIDAFHVHLPTAARARVDFPLSRPEWLGAITRHRRATLGLPLEIGNLSWPLGQQASYRMLDERYPEAYPLVHPCDHPSGRWCYRCAKCLKHLLLTLAVGRRDASFDYSHALSRGKEMVETLARLPEVAPPDGSNSPWLPEFCEDWLFDSLCFAVATIDLDHVADWLDADAIAAIARLVAHYGNVRNPMFGQVAEAAFAGVPARFRDAWRAILSEHLPLVADFPAKRLPNGTLDVMGWQHTLTLPASIAPPPP